MNGDVAKTEQYPHSFRNLFFSTKGRIGRCNWWFARQIAMVAATLIALTLAFAVYKLRHDLKVELRTVEWIGGIAGTAIFAGFAYVLFCIYVKRWHDRDKSACWIFLTVAPWVTYVAMGCASLSPLHEQIPQIPAAIIGGILGLVILVAMLWNYIEIGFFRGSIGPNQYGEDPHTQPGGKSSVLKIVVTITLAIATVIGVEMALVGGVMLYAKDHPSFDKKEAGTNHSPEDLQKSAEILNALNAASNKNDVRTAYALQTDGVDLADAKTCLAIGDIKTKVIRNASDNTKRLLSWMVPVTNKCDKKTAMNTQVIFKDADGFQIGSDDAFFESGNRTKLLDPGAQDVTGTASMDITVTTNATVAEIKLTASNALLKSFTQPINMTALNHEDATQKAANELLQCYSPQVEIVGSEPKGDHTLVSWTDWENPRCNNDKALYYRIEISGTVNFVTDTLTMSAQHSSKSALVPTAALLQPNPTLTLRYSCDDKFVDCVQTLNLPSYLLGLTKNPMQPVLTANPIPVGEARTTTILTPPIVLKNTAPPTSPAPQALPQGKAP